MPHTTRYSFGDVVLVRFPPTDKTTSKLLPAVAVSSELYHREHFDVMLMAIRSQDRAVSHDSWCPCNPRLDSLELGMLPA